MFVKLRGEFAIEYAGFATHAKERLAAGELDQAKRDAHTLSGVAANLGAGAVAKGAGDLEGALREGATAGRLDALLAGLIAALRPLIDGLRALPPDPPRALAVGATRVLSPVETKRIMHEMSTNLANFDANARDCLARHRDVFSSLFQGALPAFERRLDQYAFEDASAQLAAALEAQ